MQTQRVLELIELVAKMNEPDFATSLLISGDKITISAWAGAKKAGFAPTFSFSMKLEEEDIATFWQAEFRLRSHQTDWELFKRLQGGGDDVTASLSEKQKQIIFLMFGAKNENRKYS